MDYIIGLIILLGVLAGYAVIYVSAMLIDRKEDKDIREYFERIERGRRKND